MSKAIIMARRCITCKKSKSPDEFYRYKYVSGLRYDSRCKVCARLRRRKRYEKNKERENRTAKAWRESNREHIRKYNKKRQQCPEHKANKAKAQRTRKARERASSNNNCSEISKLYAEAIALEKLTGIKFHVDHIIPLCKGGEHKITNLQILTEQENLAKGGKMPAGDCYE